MRSFESIHFNRHQADIKPIPVAKADALRGEFETYERTKWFGRPSKAAERNEMVRRKAADGGDTETIFKDVMGLNFGTFGDAPIVPNRPANDPIAAAYADTSSAGLPVELPLTEQAVYPDVLGFRAVESAGGPAPNTSAADRARMGLSDVGPGTQILAIDGSPQQSAGSVANLDCRQVAASLGVQDVAAVVKAIKAAISFTKKGA
jgi:hypothetical protein